LSARHCSQLILLSDPAPSLRAVNTCTSFHSVRLISLLERGLWDMGTGHCNLCEHRQRFLL
jgi:hypothetical protein